VLLPSPSRRSRLRGRVALLATGAPAFVALASCRGSDRAAGAVARDTVRVAVAANFAAPHDTLAHRFAAATGITVLASIGATGQLYAQAINGAPFDVFLAADTLRAAMLEQEGQVVAGTRFTYAAGRLALYAPRAQGVINTPALLTASAIRHVAVADSATAPYGAAALELLARWGTGPALTRRLVRGESIAQTFQFVESGAAEAGFVALSQVIGKPPATYWVVPDSLHAPIAQDAVLLRHGASNAAARRYLEFLRSDSARAVITSFGYGVPARALAP
jgi:molybdate transport system substrate-binding protein